MVDRSLREARRAASSSSIAAAKAEVLKSALRSGEADLSRVESLAQLGFEPAILVVGQGRPQLPLEKWEALRAWDFSLAARGVLLALRWALLLPTIQRLEVSDLVSRWRDGVDVATAIASLPLGHGIPSAVPSFFVSGRMIRFTQELSEDPVSVELPISWAALDRAFALGADWAGDLIQFGASGPARRSEDLPADRVPFGQVIDSLAQVDRASLHDHVLSGLADYLAFGDDFLASAISQRALLAAFPEANPVTDTGL